MKVHVGSSIREGDIWCCGIDEELRAAAMSASEEAAIMIEVCSELFFVIKSIRTALGAYFFRHAWRLWVHFDDGWTGILFMQGFSVHE